MKKEFEEIFKSAEVDKDKAELLIECYAFQQYRKAIQDFKNTAKISDIRDLALTVCVMSQGAFEEWIQADMSDYRLNVIPFYKK